MKNSEIISILLVMAVVSSSANYFNDRSTYNQQLSCNPNNLDTGIKYSAISNTFIPEGFDKMGLLYMPLASAYFVSRLADALGYQGCCLTNTTFLRELDIVCPWSGYSDTSATATYSSCRLNKVFPERCTVPTPSYPHWFCKGSTGIPGTFGERFGPLTYSAALQSSNKRWTLFINCFNPKTPQNPNAKVTATAFSVFSLDPVLASADRAQIIRELNNRGFNTSPSNVIEFDYTTTKCTCN